MTIPTDSQWPHIYPDAKTAPEPFLLICPDSVNYLTPNLACFCLDKNWPMGSKSSNFVQTGEQPVWAYSRVLVGLALVSHPCHVGQCPTSHVALQGPRAGTHGTDSVDRSPGAEVLKPD